MDDIAPGGGSAALPSPEDVWREAAPALSGLCPEDVPRERLHAAAALATVRAFASCTRRSCADCDALWAESGLACDGRQTRLLGKQLAQACLPLLRRGVFLVQARAALGPAASAAMRSARRGSKT